MCGYSQKIDSNESNAKYLAKVKSSGSNTQNAGKDIYLVLGLEQ